jgi:uncharacterized protein with PQ loop repeat
LKEIQALGLNQATLSSLGVMIFGIIGAYGQWKQARLIWSSRSAQSVSIRWTLTFLFMFLAYLVQGIHTDRVIMSFQGGLRAAFYFPIICGIVMFAFDRVSRKDLVFLLTLTIGIVIMIISNEWKGLIFQLFGYLGVLMALDQPYQIWKNKSRGRVSMTMLITFTSAVVFWTWYAWIFKDMRLFWLSLSFIIVYLFTIVLWRKYPQGQ